MYRSSLLFILVLLSGLSIVNAQTPNINLHAGSETTSFANFYDSGGEYANYQDDEDITMTIYPEDSTAKICVTFHEFQTQSGTNADILYVYDGNSTSAPLIAKLKRKELRYT